MEIHEITSIILKELARMVQPGITTEVLDILAGTLIADYGVESCNKGYHPEWAKQPYPNFTCINVNSIIAHGIPSGYALQEGDICSIDIAIKKDGICGDAALTVPVGQISPRNERLIRYAKQAVYEALKYVKAGADTEDIARAIDLYCVRNGYVTNLRFGGHTIGSEVHMKPSIYNNLHESHEYAKLVEGQVICVEPMITYNDRMGIMLSDGWTAVTSDRKNSAFFEHMVLVEKDGCKVLTDHF